jgi:hypothetical protein
MKCIKAFLQIIEGLNLNLAYLNVQFVSELGLIRLAGIDSEVMSDASCALSP